jgi:hypothetical protein
MNNGSYDDHRSLRRLTAQHALLVAPLPAVA